MSEKISLDSSVYFSLFRKEMGGSVVLLVVCLDFCVSVICFRQRRVYIRQCRVYV